MILSLPNGSLYDPRTQTVIDAKGAYPALYTARPHFHGAPLEGPELCCCILCGKLVNPKDPVSLPVIRLCNRCFQEACDLTKKHLERRVRR